MNRNTNNMRGFTLVELLAVIVVLAIVMLIAVQAILPQMENARKSVFALEANGAIDAAQTYFMNNSLSSGQNGFPVADGGTSCISIDDLIDKGYSDLEKGTYSGKVIVTKKANSTLYLYTVYIQKNQTLVVAGKGNDAGYNADVVGSDVVDYAQWDVAYETCS